MSDPSKVTKVLINKIHGGRKQDSKFWQSEFSGNDNKGNPKQTGNKSNLVEFLSLFLLSVIGIGIVIYGGYFLYNRYKIEFSQPEPIATQTPKQSHKRPQIKKRIRNENKPITKKELDKAIEKALNKRQSPPSNIPNLQSANSYYQVELKNGSLIKAKSASKNGNRYTINDINGLEFSLNRNEIKEVKKITYSN
jgi:hypothetical protein